MSTRNLIHLFLAIPTLAGVGILLILLVNAGSSDLTDRNGIGLAIEAWNGILGAVPAEMPSVYPEEPDEPLGSADDLSESMRQAYILSNAFIVSCSLLIVLGTCGLAAMGTALSSHEPPWNPFLRTGALLFITLGGFLAIGFNLAYPGDFNGVIGFPSFYLPGSIDSVEYDLFGISEWADLLFIAAYAFFAAALILSLSHGRVHSTPLFLVAIPVSIVLFPIVVSWKWGGGWLDALMNNYDFAGAGLLHWHLGTGVFAISLIIMIFGRWREKTSSDENSPPPRLAVYIAGGFFYLLGLVAINAGSALQAAPETVAPILQATLAAGLVSGFLGMAWAILSPTKPFLRFFIVGAAAGMVAVSGSTDSLTLTHAIAFGVTSGFLVPGATVLLEKLKWVDPLSIFPVHGIGGVIAVLGTAGFDDGSSIPGQLTLLFTVPIPTTATALLIGLIAGASRYLLISRTPRTPPELPGSA